MNMYVSLEVSKYECKYIFDVKYVYLNFSFSLDIVNKW